MDISLRMLADASNAQGAFKDFGSVVTVAGGIVKQFAADSIKAYADAERVQKQLQAAAGEYTKALSDQAEVLKQKYAVDDDQIRQLEVLALRYGAAPGQIKAATEAVLNFSAATGQDATSAMQQLVRGVESGTGSLGRMGVHFKTTGDFVKDMSAATDALGQKFAGAGEADADSLSGRMRKASMASDDLKKAVGAVFDEMDKKAGILDKVTESLNRMADSVKRNGIMASLLDPRFGFQSATEKAGLVPLPDERAWDPKGNNLGWAGGGGGLPMTSAGDHAVGPSKDKKLGSLDNPEDWGWGSFGNPDKEFSGWEREYKEAAEKQALEVREQDIKLAQLADKAREEEEKADAKHDEDMLKSKQETFDIEYRAEEKAEAAQERLREKFEAEQKRQFDQQAKLWEHAGDAMGAALVNAIGAQLERLSEGGDVDVGEMTGSIVEIALTTLGAVIGTIYGAPQLGGAIGGLAGGLAHKGISSAFKKHHDGGWIERFHDGGWPGGLAQDERLSITQVGERVLSRQQVSNIGGPAAVDSLARGGGGGRGMVVNIHALDTQSFSDSFGRDAGRGFFNAIRVGRGDLVPLFK